MPVLESDLSYLLPEDFFAEEEGFDWEKYHFLNEKKTRRQIWNGNETVKGNGNEIVMMNEKMNQNLWIQRILVYVERGSP